MGSRDQVSAPILQKPGAGTYSCQQATASHTELRYVVGPENAIEPPDEQATA